MSSSIYSDSITFMLTSISYGSILEALLHILEDPMLGTSEVFRCVCFLKSFLNMFGSTVT